MDLAQDRVDFPLEPLLAASTGGGTGVMEIGEEEDLVEEREELGLPVLQCAAAHLEQVGEEMHRRAMLVLQADILIPAGEPLGAEEHEEDRARNPSQAVASEGLPHAHPFASVRRENCTNVHEFHRRCRAMLDRAELNPFTWVKSRNFYGAKNHHV